MSHFAIRAISAFSVLAFTAGLPVSSVFAASGDKIVSESRFNADIYEILLDQADENGDGQLNEYELSLVTDLDLSGLGLDSLKGLAYLPNLSWLDASDNELRSVSSMGDCPYITWLDLSNNNISSLTGINRLKRLEELDLSNNSLTSASTLGNLNFLTTLNLSNNNFTRSSSLSGLDSVTELVLDGNSLREIDDLPDDLVYLSARNNEITDFRLASINSELEYLDLSDNQIETLPDMKYLTSLRTCYLTNNEISDTDGGWVQKDCIIDLSRNQIDTTDDEWIADMNSLVSNGCTVTLVPQKMKGWQEENGKTYYFLDSNGTYASGTHSIDGKTYTFDQFGVLNGSGSSSSTNNGWITENGSTYYEDQNGTRKKGWLWLENSWYYLDPTTGARKTGWQWIGNTWYYLDPQTGKMATGWLQLGQNWYYLTSSGAMVTGNQTIDGKTYTFNSSGVLTNGTPPSGSGESGGATPQQPEGSGWITQNNTKYYRKDDGSYHKGWLQLGDYWYYLDSSTGAMTTGWQKIQNIWYYLDPQSGIMATGWLNLSGNWYYLNQYGCMVTGSQTINGVSYSFNSNGTLNGNPPADAGSGNTTSPDTSASLPNGNGWKTENGITTYTKADGSKATGWLLYENNWYYLNSSSGALTTGWQKVGNTWYYLDPKSGKMVTGWLDQNGKRYYLYPGSGAMAYEWFRVDGIWHLTDTSGALITSQWYDYKGDKYYLTATGQVARYWSQIDGKWYYFTSDGAMYHDAWIPTSSGNSWCYLGSDGVMVTGWNTIGGKTYYMRKSDGYCLVNGWYKIDGKSYYFYADGHLAVNTTVDGYQVGSDGAWIS
ncbi:MAG: leucine-rich repeat domain-containing protein [Candidatus Merdivicinus sp.]